MKDVPDIDPEVLGLMEEIVADPRSAMRLVPRKALRSWFDTGEVARASEIATTRAERHLIEEHRESLAALLCEAAWIAYWKAPVLAHRPVDENGNLYDPTERESDWARRGKRFSLSHSGLEAGTGLLRDCLSGVEAERANDLAVASLALVPCDQTRFYAALTLPWSSPRSAIRLFDLLSHQAVIAHVRRDAWLSLGARLCAVERIAEARSAYQQHSRADSTSPYGHICALVLSCLLGDETVAVQEAGQLQGVVTSKDPLLTEERDQLRKWRKTLSPATLARAQRYRSAILDHMPEVGTFILEALDP